MKRLTSNAVILFATTRESLAFLLSGPLGRFVFVLPSVDPLPSDNGSNNRAVLSEGPNLDIIESGTSGGPNLVCRVVPIPLVPGCGPSDKDAPTGISTRIVSERYW